MSDAVREVTIRIGLEYVNTAPPQIDTSAAQKAVDGLGDTVKKAIATINSSIESAQPHVESFEESYTRAMREAEKQSNTASQAALKTASSLKQAGEGAFTMARGIAFLTSDTDEGFREMVETIARVQGAFDVFKGGADLLIGLANAQKAMNAASKAAAASEAALATAHAAAAAGATVQTAATVGTTTAVQSLTAAMLANPMTAALVAAAAAATALFAAMKSGGHEAEETLKRQNELLQQHLDLFGALKERASSLSAGRMRELDVQWQLAGGSFDTDKAIEGLREQREWARDQASRDLTEVPGFDLGAIPNDPEFDVGFENIQQGTGSNEAKIEAYERLESSLEDQVALVEKESEAREHGLDLLRDDLALMEAKVDEAAKLVQEEEKRLSLNEEIGRLSEMQLSELEALSEKVRTGAELTADELKRLEELAPRLTGEFVGREFAERGAGATEGLLGTFQVDPTEAQAALQQAQKNVEDMKSRISKEAEEIEAANRESWEELLAMFRTLTDISGEVARLRQEIATKEAAGSGR